MGSFLSVLTGIFFLSWIAMAIFVLPYGYSAKGSPAFLGFDRSEHDGCSNKKINKYCVSIPGAQCI